MDGLYHRYGTSLGFTNWDASMEEQFPDFVALPDRCKHLLDCMQTRFPTEAPNIWGFVTKGAWLGGELEVTDTVVGPSHATGDWV